MSMLSLSQVFFDYEGKNILEEITTGFEEGTTTIILGASGSGKSTLLKIAAGLMVQQQGSVLFNGKELGRLNELETIELRRKMGFVFQDGALWANKTIYQNLELPLLFHHPELKASEIRKKITYFAQRFGITDDLENRPSQLSNGEQQIASLIRALILDPEIVLLDEPTAHLDGQSRSKVIDYLVELKKKGKTLIMVTQIPEITSRIADELILLKSGRILTQGKFSAVVRNPEPEVMEILTSVLSQASTFSSDILDLLGG